MDGEAHVERAPRQTRPTAPGRTDGRHGRAGFTATRLDLNGLLGVSCRPLASVSGTWVFTSPEGQAEAGDPEYSSGNALFLAIDSPAGAPSSTCAIRDELITLTTWQLNGPLGLSVEVDPDSPCFGQPWVWQETAAR